VCHLDEAGFAMTLATSYSWGVRGQRLHVPYQAPEGRRVNAIGAYFTHGPSAGRLVTQTWATLPKRSATRPRSTAAEQAAKHGLGVDEVGPIDAARVVAFVWQMAGRPADAPPSWTRERPLVVVLDNYSVHHSELVKAEQQCWAAAGIELVQLAAYSPELSQIEPIWNDVKQHQLPVRSFAQAGALKRAVDAALTDKATHVLQAASERMKSTNHDRLPT
jgi:putative transposase